MKVGILSDTHSCFDDRFAKYFADCDEIWHAGDIGDVDTLQRLMGIGPKLRAVSGNIDPQSVRRYCPEMLEFEVNGCRVIMQHICGYPGRYAPGVKRLLAEKRPHILVAGHSHILKVMFDRDLSVLHINPGAAGHHGWQQVRTLIRMDITDEGTPSNLEVIELGPRLPTPCAPLR